MGFGVLKALVRTPRVSIWCRDEDRMMMVTTHHEDGRLTHREVGPLTPEEWTENKRFQ